MPEKRTVAQIRAQIDKCTHTRDNQNVILCRELRKKAVGEHMGFKKTTAIRDRGRIVGDLNRRLRDLRTELRLAQRTTREKER